MCYRDLETISKMSFGSISLLEASLQILDNQQVACGLKLGSAVILNQNPIFEMASSKISEPLID